MAEPTKFLVLCKKSPSNGDAPLPVGIWEEVATVSATSKEAALRQIGGTEGVYVAVPARSWTPVSLTVERTERVKLAPAAAPQAVAS